MEMLSETSVISSGMVFPAKKLIPESQPATAAENPPSQFTVIHVISGFAMP